MRLGRAPSVRAVLVLLGGLGGLLGPPTRARAEDPPAAPGAAAEAARQAAELAAFEGRWSDLDRIGLGAEATAASGFRDSVWRLSPRAGPSAAAVPLEGWPVLSALALDRERREGGGIRSAEQGAGHPFRTLPDGDGMVAYALRLQQFAWHPPAPEDPVANPEGAAAAQAGIDLAHARRAEALRAGYAALASLLAGALLAGWWLGRRTNA